jgi:hypothetical protein
VQMKVRQGTICPHAAMRYLVPLARANKGACGRLAEHVGNVRLSARQTGTLYAAWGRACRNERTRIEENPLLYLKAVEQMERHASPAAPAGADPGNLFKDMEIFIRVCHRMRQGLDEGALKSAAETIVRKLGKRWQESLLAFESVRETMEEVLHAGRGRAQGHL